MDPKLFVDAFWISPWSFGAYVALAEKGVAFDVVDVALDKGEQRDKRHARALPFGKIPGLVHGDLAVAESLAIIEYVEERWPAPRHTRVLPEEIGARARARMVLAWLRTDLGALRAERPTSTMFYEKATAPLTDAGAAAAEKLLAFADAAIPDGAANLFEGRWSLADAELAFCLQRLILNGHRTSAKISHFVEAQWTRPSVRAFIDHERPPYVAY